MYRKQLINFKPVIVERHLEFATKDETSSFHHDNAWFHVARLVKNNFKKSGWKVLPHLPFSPDITPSGYLLFHSCRMPSLNHVAHQKLISNTRFLLGRQAIAVLWHGNHKLSERWKKVRKNVHEYCHTPYT